MIGAAHKSLKHGMKFSEVDELSRSQLEEGADFLGLIIMQNLVKKETYGAIAELHKADIVTLMVTGDNIQVILASDWSHILMLSSDWSDRHQRGPRLRARQG